MDAAGIAAQCADETREVEQDDLPLPMRNHHSPHPDTRIIGFAKSRRHFQARCGQQQTVRTDGIDLIPPVHRPRSRQAIKQPVPTDEVPSPLPRRAAAAETASVRHHPTPRQHLCRLTGGVGRDRPDHQAQAACDALQQWRQIGLKRLQRERLPVLAQSVRKSFGEGAAGNHFASAVRDADRVHEGVLVTDTGDGDGDRAVRGIHGEFPHGLFVFTARRRERLEVLENGLPVDARS